MSLTAASSARRRLVPRTQRRVALRTTNGCCLSGSTSAVKDADIPTPDQGSRMLIGVMLVPLNIAKCMAPIRVRSIAHWFSPSTRVDRHLHVP